MSEKVKHAKRHVQDMRAKTKNFGWVFALLLVAQFIATTALIVALNRLNLLQTWQYALVLIVLYALFALNLILLFRAKAKAGKIVAVILALILTAHTAVIDRQFFVVTSDACQCVVEC